MDGKVFQIYPVFKPPRIEPEGRKIKQEKYLYYSTLLNIVKINCDRDN